MKSYSSREKSPDRSTKIQPRGGTSVSPPTQVVTPGNAGIIQRCGDIGSKKDGNKTDTPVFSGDLPAVMQRRPED